MWHKLSEFLWFSWFCFLYQINVSTFKGVESECSAVKTELKPSNCLNPIFCWLVLRLLKCPGDTSGQGTKNEPCCIFVFFVLSDSRQWTVTVERACGPVFVWLRFPRVQQTQPQEAAVDCVPAHSPEPAQLPQCPWAAHHSWGRLGREREVRANNTHHRKLAIILSLFRQKGNLSETKSPVFDQTLATLEKQGAKRKSLCSISHSWRQSRAWCKNNCRENTKHSLEEVEIQKETGTYTSHTHPSGSMKHYTLFVRKVHIKGRCHLRRGDMS